MKIIKFLFIASVVILSGCGALHSYRVLPQHLESKAEISEFPGVRVWGNEIDGLKKSAMLSVEQERAANHGQLAKEVSGLALSGGGQDGAFGAGFLYGWTKRGTRPEFKIVTGISTGALMAPFAFLGPKYDERLRIAYTTITDKNIYKPHNLFFILLSLVDIRPIVSLADSRPLAHLINELIDEKVLKEIAREYKKGRRLFVGTTQLNAQRLVIWDMGAIAASRSPNALALFRKILLASASLPATFPPQYFHVKAGNQHYTEMHVDGGVQTQVMLFENAMTPFHKIKRKDNLYIIQNQKVYPTWKYVEPHLKYIALHTVNTVIENQGASDLYRIYLYAHTFGIDYHLAFIPPQFYAESDSKFDRAYMNKLFNVGYRMALSDKPWYPYPPGLEALVSAGSN